MKLLRIKNKMNYIFLLVFENGIFVKSDLKDLISEYVSLEDLKTGKINEEWGCLEFKGGMVDIEPKTLYNYAMKTGKHKSKRL